MTGPAPRFNMRWDDPGREFEVATRVAVVTGRFVDPRLEAAFRRQAWPEWSSRLRIVTLLAATLILSFGYTDYLALGLGVPLYVCWGLRVAVFAGALGVAWLSYGRPHIGRLDRAMFGLLLLFSTALFVVVALQNKGVMFEAPGVVLMILGFYLFVPTRFEIQLASSVFVSAGFLTIATRVLAPSVEELFTVAVEILICNALGAFTALRTHVLHRREFVGLRQVQRRARFEELIARLSTRFITLPLEAVGEAIGSALAEIGEFAAVDRTYVFEFDTDTRLSTCTHEWCRPGIRPAMRTLQRVPYDAYSWAMSELLHGRVIAAEKLSDLPPEAAPERAESERHGVRSWVVLPLTFGNRVLGAVGFHAVRREMSWGQDQVAVLRMVGEMIIGVIVRKRVNQQLAEQTRTLEKSVAALERSNSELQQFAYVASHDLQEPLRSISSFSSLLGERYRGQLDAKANEYIGYLTTAANRMHDLIRDLLSYSRLDSRARPFVRCQTKQIVEQALANLRLSIEEAGAEITVAVAPEVDGDASQLLQLFQNLIGNAVKFHDAEKPRIAIGARRDGDRWQFGIADNGIGIAPRHTERIFQVFTRLNARDRYPGTGIGLAVCRRIVERHRGRIWVEPNSPRGSVFHFTLPARFPEKGVGVI